jgi:REP-associated tyrosine transposase
MGTQTLTPQRPKTGKHHMGRSRYTITEPDKPHFMTCTVVEWLPVFTRPETVQILLDCWQFQRQQSGLKLYGYVILENHLHFIAQSASLNKCVASFKAYTARQIIDHLQDKRADRLLQRLRLAKCAHKQDRDFQFWQEGVHAELILNEAMMREKLDYIHANPVKRGYVNLPEHWGYSSASNYAGQRGLLEIDLW